MTNRAVLRVRFRSRTDFPNLRRVSESPAASTTGSARVPSETLRRFEAREIGERIVERMKEYVEVFLRGMVA